MIGEFLTWWGQQLRSLWPGDGALQRGDLLQAALQGREVSVSLRRRGRTGELGRYALTESGMAALAAALGKRRRPAELILPSQFLLERTVALPLAAERDPARVLRYEMDRLTPFSADELYWSWAATRDRARAQLQVRLTMVLRGQVDAALEMLSRAGLQPSWLVSDSGHRLALAAGAGAAQRRIRIGLAALCLPLAIAAVAVPFVQQSLESRRIEKRIAQSRPAVDRAEALRRAQAQAAGAVDVLAKARARFGDPLATLAALTNILPDDTVLTDLTLRQRTMVLNGQSASAARLIPALAADPDIRDPAFTAPVTRSDVLHADIFTIRAQATLP